MAFFEAAPIKRTEAIAEIRRAVADLRGVESLGCGGVDAGDYPGTEHSWLSVWRVSGRAEGEALLTALGAAGWFHWFDSTTVRSEIRPSEVVEESLLAIAHIEGTL